MERPNEYEPEDEQPDPEELELIAALSAEQVQAIDAALLAAADSKWRKVAFLIAMAMTRPDRIPGIPDVYYAQRVREMVFSGTLEAQGVLSRMRYSEVRISSQVGGHEA
ncbi:hypothetical protein FZO89_03480 [Luteimonas viscosa]|uniref:DUF3658 domain-containing protein n=1 Tax=Luteimonas viscosa TaxID=1132694 RepID=A0A5D4XN89_9GAMM|nr:DUF3658 domain-containing protein [Luteimonas viscosa]TYT25403.1 hypothetical protein FZO89_03480 [Luteimonas viscosa]